jgi:hypothetical protein
MASQIRNPIRLHRSRGVSHYRSRARASPSWARCGRRLLLGLRSGLLADEACAALCGLACYPVRLPVVLLRLSDSMLCRPAVKNLLHAEVLLILVSILRFGQSPQAPSQIDSDSSQRILHCIHVLTHDVPALRNTLLNECRLSFEKLLRERAGEKEAAAAASQTSGADGDIVQADAVLKIRQLRAPIAAGAVWEDDEPETPSGVGGSGKSTKSGVLHDGTERVHQLTGFSDPLFAEARVTARQYDIGLDITVRLASLLTWSPALTEFLSDYESDARHSAKCGIGTEHAGRSEASGAASDLHLRALREEGHSSQHQDQQHRNRRDLWQLGL